MFILLDVVKFLALLVVDFAALPPVSVALPVVCYVLPVASVVPAVVSNLIVVYELLGLVVVVILHDVQDEDFS